MTILCKDTLLNFLDLIGDGASVGEASSAVGAAPKSKIVFKWIADSEAAGEFGAIPDTASPWCLEWKGSLDWLHVHYEVARANGRANRAMRSPPIRQELEERLEARRANRVPAVAPSAAEEHVPPEVIVEHARARAAILDPSPPPPPPIRPSYAFRAAPALDRANAEAPMEGRFTMAADRPKSKAERRAGTVEVTDLGIRRW